MATEWFRNTEWNEEIAEAFFAKLKRARDKHQYLRIQAGYLEDKYPDVSLDLLERFLLLGDNWDTAQALLQKARVLSQLGRVDDAIQSGFMAFNRERIPPSVITQVGIWLPLLIAQYQKKEFFDQALEILGMRSNNILFPSEQFYFWAALALMQSSNGNMEESRESARKALTHAEAKTSGFPRHKKVGLIDKKDGALVSQMHRLAQ